MAPELFNYDTLQGNASKVIMPYIPQEILDMIIGYATADAYFSNCASFVSPTFHQIIFPYTKNSDH
jgi:hypothetical protein